MKHYKITLTEDISGLWLAQLTGIESNIGAKVVMIYGDVKGTPEKALASLVKKAKFRGSRAIVIEESNQP